MKHNETGERSVRLLRVGEQVRHILSEILQRGDVHDQTLATHPVSVTEVRMSPDLRHATVFVKPLLGRDEEAVLKARITRNDVIIYQGEINSLRRFKDDVAEVRAGLECGVTFTQNFTDIKAGDYLETFEVELRERTL